MKTHKKFFSLPFIVTSILTLFFLLSSCSREQTSTWKYHTLQANLSFIKDPSKNMNFMDKKAQDEQIVNGIEYTGVYSSSYLYLQLHNFNGVSYDTGSFPLVNSTTQLKTARVYFEMGSNDTDHFESISGNIHVTGSVVDDGGGGYKTTARFSGVLINNHFDSIIVSSGALKYND